MIWKYSNTRTVGTENKFLHPLSRSAQEPRRNCRRGVAASLVVVFVALNFTPFTIPVSLSLATWQSGNGNGTVAQSHPIS